MRGRESGVPWKRVALRRGGADGRVPVNAGWFPVGGYANASANDMSQNMLGAGDAEDGLLTHAAAPGTVSVRSQVVLTYKIK